MLFLIHIPKSGGTSIYNALRSIIPERLVWYNSVNTAPQSFFARPDYRQSTSVYAGHFTYSSIKEFLAPEDKIFSAIREPIERAFSHYNHISVRDKSHPLHLEIKDRSIIDAAAASPRFALEISNSICLFLSGTRNSEKAKTVVLDNSVKLYGMRQLRMMIEEIAKECGVSGAPKLDFDNAAEQEYASQINKEELNFVKSMNQEDCKFFTYFEDNRVFVPTKAP
jgi:hypothetical protein